MPGELQGREVQQGRHRNDRAFLEGARYLVEVWNFKPRKAFESGFPHEI